MSAFFHLNQCYKSASLSQTPEIVSCLHFQCPRPNCVCEMYSFQLQHQRDQHGEQKPLIKGNPDTAITRTLTFFALALSTLQHCFSAHTRTTTLPQWTPLPYQQHRALTLVRLTVCGVQICSCNVFICWFAEVTFPSPH